jgi:hypothetical protein
MKKQKISLREFKVNSFITEPCNVQLVTINGGVNIDLSIVEYINNGMKEVAVQICNGTGKIEEEIKNYLKK